MTDGSNGFRSDEELEKNLKYLLDIGFRRLTREIAEERVALRSVELQTAIHTFELESFFEIRRQEEIEDRLIRFNSQLFDKASTYNNVVATLVYAGFFAIWSYTKGQIVDWDTAFIGALLGFSIFVFIFWTLAVSLHNAKSASSFAEVCIADYDDNEKMLDAMLAQEAKTAESALKFKKWWAPAFYWSSGTGFFAGICLIVLLFTNVVGVDFTIHDTSVNILTFLKESFENIWSR